MRKDDINIGIVCTLSGQQHILHCPNAFKWVFTHRVGVAEGGSFTPWGCGMYKYGCVATIENLEDRVENWVAKVGSISVGVHADAVEVKMVEAVLEDAFD